VLQQNGSAYSERASNARDNVASKARTLRNTRSFHHDGEDDDDTVGLVNGALMVVKDAHHCQQKLAWAARLKFEF
jgi:hypothetical protein